MSPNKSAHNIYGCQSRHNRLFFVPSTSPMVIVQVHTTWMALGIDATAQIPSVFKFLVSFGNKAVDERHQDQRHRVSVTKLSG